MFGRILLEQLFGSENEVSYELALAIGQRVGRRVTSLALSREFARLAVSPDRGPLREWLLTDLPGEEPLPLPLKEGTWSAWQCNECGSDEFTAAVSEQDLEYLTCTACGANEFHKVTVGR